MTETGLAAMPTITATGSRLTRGAVLGAVIAGIGWAVSGVVAVVDPGWDVGPAVSLSAQVIEGSHAMAETAMIPALLGLWKAQRTRLRRLGQLGFWLAVAATALMAVITYVGVIVAMVGITGSSLVVTVLFLLSVMGWVVGFIMCGIATIQARVWPPATGPLLIAHPLLGLAILASYELWESYAMFIAVGVLWFTLAWILSAPMRSEHKERHV
jgi:hypothetical protein